MIQTISETLFQLFVLSVVIERSLSVIFESYWYNKYLQPLRIKEVIAFIISYVCILYSKIDIVAIATSNETLTWIGLIITALAVSGGSKISLAIFRDLLNVRNKDRNAPID